MHTHISSSQKADLELPTTSLLGMARRYWSNGVRLRSEAMFAFGVSLVWLLAYNPHFWGLTIGAMWHNTAGSALFLLSLFAFVWSLQAVLLLLMPTRRLMMGFASALFLVASVSSHFSAKYGVIMDKGMLRNVLETDAVESRGLMSMDLLIQFVALGIVPALLVWTIKLPATRWSTRLRKRAIAITGALAVCVVALLSTPASYAVFFREFKPIRYTLMPAAPIASAFSLASHKNKANQGPLINASGDAKRSSPPRSRPLAIVMVVGETARASNFQLEGYSRATNPELAALPGLVYFGNAVSCGTATAVSVPCMFSHLPRQNFDVDAAPRYANALDALQQAGVDVEWRDNNAGCKGVCARVLTIQYTADEKSKWCRDSYCYDEVMLQDLAAKLASLQRDTVIVMHQIGSHGPGYAERYPPEFERFKPACRSNELQRCTAEEVTNAYDNSIAYTDHVLARTAQLLRDAADHADVMMMYASDHGESLGEKGVYLHGLPYSFAPETQKRVPMLMWLSPGYVARQNITVDCAKARAATAVSHDNLYHTLLGAAEVRNTSYMPSMDLLAQCRRAGGVADHE